MHKTWCVHINLASSVVSCKYRRIMCASGKWPHPISTTSTKARKIHAWRVRIGRATSLLSYMHRTMSYYIVQGWQAIVVACVHLVTSVVSILHWPIFGDLVQGMHTSNIVCTHLLGNTDRGLCTFAKGRWHWSCPAYIIVHVYVLTGWQRSWLAHICQWETSSIIAFTHYHNMCIYGKPRLQMSDDIGKGVHCIKNGLCATVGNISHGLHMLIIMATLFLACECQQL